MGVMSTDYMSKVNVLATFWIDFSAEEGLEGFDGSFEDLFDFVEYSDVGLPLAYMEANEIATPTQQGRDFIDQTFAGLLSLLGVSDDGFESLEEMLKKAFP